MVKELKKKSNMKKSTPIKNKKGKMTTRQYYRQGMDAIINYIKENPGVNKEDVRDLVIKHNRSLEGMDLKSSKNFTHAKIPVSHAWKFLPKDKKPVEKVDTDKESQYYYRGAVKPGTIEEAERRFGSAIAPLSDPARQAARDKFYQESTIDNPILKTGFKLPGFGKRK
jgi:hypothetical protein